MFKSLSLALTFFLGSPAFAGPRTRDAVKIDLRDGVLTATLKDGFHFNEKAPNAVAMDDKVIKPTSLGGREVKFNGLPKEFAKGEATLYICDDAVTFCETEMIDLKNGAPVASPTAATKGSALAVKEIKPNKHGFFEDDLNRAVAEAKAANKLILVDFSARWCPGCVRLEMETFSTAAFKKMTENLVKVKIDLDRFENGVIADKYVVKGIPTLLVMTADQEEVARIVDYQPNEVLQPFFESVQQDPISLRALTEKAREKDPGVLLRLGRRLLAAGRAGEALETFKSIKPAPPDLIEAQIQAYPKEVKVLKNAIASEPGSVRSLGWRATLADLTERFDEKLKIRNEGVALADEWLSQPAKLKEALKNERPGEFAGFEKFMVAMMRAELIEAAGGTNSEKDAAWKKAAQTGTDLKIPARNLGVSMRHLIVLTKAKEYQQGNRVALRLIKSDPKNPELQRRRLRLLLELNDFDGVVAVGKRVIKNSYGRNEFWAAEMMAKAYVKTNKPKEAREFIEAYLRRPEMDWPNMKETRKTFEEMRAKLPGVTAG